MKKRLLIYVCILLFFEIKGQENEIYFINAPTGLIIRDLPSLNSNRIGKLPYGSIVELLEETEFKQRIIDNNDTINGIWLKIKYNNYPFIVSESESEYGYEQEGYVFSGYAEKLNKAQIKTKELDSLQFYNLFTEPKPYKHTTIKSEEEAKKLLASNVKWKTIEHLGNVISEINLNTGQTLHINQKSNDYWFVAYYPLEQIILFEGGHSSDYSISLKTGESLKTVGNPEYIIESPNKKLRLNGWFPGQECSSYFFQEKLEDNYRYLAKFGWGGINGENVCYFNKFCWVSNSEFVYSYTDYSKSIEVEKYVIGNIVIK
ncbi:MAG: SH3 domain-containing protein [Flavobacteriaceae bacterium]